MKRKNGFTLIELLAVIVILAIIALIATPLVLKYIEKSRKESKVDSAYSFVRNLETEIANYSIKHNGKKYNGQPSDKGYYELDSFNGSEIDTTVKGDKPDTIKVCLSSLGQVEKAMFEYGKYYVNYDGKKGSISDKDTYDNFSCSGNGGNVAKVEVPEASKEFDMVLMTNYGSIKNNQGIVYYSDTEREKEALEDEDDMFKYGYSSVETYEVPASLFKEAIPDTNSTIPVEITFLDGSVKIVNLIYKENDSGYMVWYYEESNDVPYHQYGAGWSIGFRPYCDYYRESCTDNYQYHYFYANIYTGTSHGWHSLKILGTTLYFSSDVAIIFASGDVDNFEFDDLYQDQTKLTKVIVNYEDNTQDIYNVSDKDFNSYGALAIKNGNHVLRMYRDTIEIHYKNNNFEYKKDIFKDIPKVSTITFEENGVMTTYKISDNHTVLYWGIGD